MVTAENDSRLFPQLTIHKPLGTIKTKSMRTTKLVLFLISISIISCRTESKKKEQTTEKTIEIVSDFNNSKINELDSLIHKLVSEKKTAGFALGIQIGNAEPITKEYGFADLETNKKVKPFHQFRIASITKPFTATAILKLIEMKELSLDDKLDEFFPNYPNGQNISIYQLLSHTSGIPNWWNGGMPENEPKNFPMCKNPHQYLQEMKNISLFEPGEFYKYSNSGYVLLGEIIEKISGQSYEKFLSENIFEPAGMTKTEMEHIERVSENWVNGYALDNEKENPFIKPEIYHMPFSAGGLRSTTTDLLNFVSSLNSNKIIETNLVKDMITYGKLNNGKPNYEGYYVPEGSKPRKSYDEIKKSGYGFGLNLMELYQNPVFYHSGGIAGFNSYLIHIPKSNSTVIFLANTENGIIPELKEILKVVTEIE